MTVSKRRRPAHPHFPPTLCRPRLPEQARTQDSEVHRRGDHRQLPHHGKRRQIGIGTAAQPSPSRRWSTRSTPALSAENNATGALASRHEQQYTGSLVGHTYSDRVRLRVKGETTSTAVGAVGCWGWSIPLMRDPVQLCGAALIKRGGGGLRSAWRAFGQWPRRVWREQHGSGVSGSSADGFGVYGQSGSDVACLATASTTMAGMVLALRATALKGESSGGYGVEGEARHSAGGVWRKHQWHWRAWRRF